MLLCKEFTFDAAHKLENYVGLCANLHGHTYRLQVIIAGKIGKNGMVLDFGDLKEIVHNLVLKNLDHTFINTLIPQPTAENITLWIWKQLEKKIPLYEIRLWETPTSFVSYRGDEKEKKHA